MGNQIFSAKTLENGKKLLLNHQVHNLKKEGHNITAMVKENSYYYVTYHLNDKNKITGMNCSCISASKGIHCKHEAAVYFAIQQTSLLQNKPKNSLTFKELYEQVNDDEQLYKLVENKLNDILPLRTVYIKVAIEKISQLINELDTLNLNEENRIKCNSIIIDAIHKLIHQDSRYADDVIEWLSSNMIENKHSQYYSLFEEACKNASPLMIVKESISILSHHIDTQVSDNVIKILFQTLTANHMNTREYINKLGRYKDNVYFQYYYLNMLLNDGEIKKASDEYNEYVKKYGENTLLKDIQQRINVNFNDPKSYIQYTLDNINRKNKTDTLNKVKALKEDLGEQWEEYRDDFYDGLSQKMADSLFMSILKDLDEWQYMVSLVTESYSIDILETYKSHIIKHSKELYVFLYTETLYKHVKYLKNRNQYYSFTFYLNDLKGLGCDEDNIIEVVSCIKDMYSNRTALIEVLDHYIDGGENDDRDYIRYYY